MQHPLPNRRVRAFEPTGEAGHPQVPVSHTFLQPALESGHRSTLLEEVVEHRGWRACYHAEPYIGLAGQRTWLLADGEPACSRLG